MESVGLLLADDDDAGRSRLAVLARARVEAVEVLEAADGAEAVQVGLQQRPQIALLDVGLPRLGGIEAAITLRECEPRMRIALWSGDAPAYRDRAREEHLLLFDKLDADRALGWVEAQARELAARLLPRHRSLECSGCGYGIARAAPPERCPMCQRSGAWVQAPWRLWSREHELRAVRI
jgi:CheY-like chemotaxis protein